MLFRWKIQCISILYIFTICPVMKYCFFTTFLLLNGYRMNIYLRFIRYKTNLFIKKHVYITESHLCTCLFHIISLLLLFAYIALIFCPCQQHLLQLNRVVYIHVQHFVNDSNKNDTLWYQCDLYCYLICWILRYIILRLDD